MSSTVIQVQNLSKAYQIGQIGTGTISRDLERFVTTKILGKEDPFLKIGETNDRSTKGESDIVWSLKDINFEINQGDAVGIIGKNGAGKSTLLKLLSRVTSPTTGSIKVKGRIASLLEVGTGFHPELSGRENIFLNGAILGMRKKEITRKLDEIIDFSGVERYIDTPVKRYSSGMYVRLAFAVAAHLESEILIVDEVLAVGDAEFQKKCLGKMGDISKGEGRTVLFVSHNMAAVQNLCSKGIYLENGKIKNLGEIKDVLIQYNSNAMNTINIVPNSHKNVYLKYFFNYDKIDNTKKITSGKDAVFEFVIESKIEIKNVIIGIGINDFLGNRLITPFSLHENKKYNLNIGENIIKCELPMFMLKPGQYFAEIHIGAKDEILDYYDKGILIEIDNVEGGKISFIPTKSQGYLIVNQIWI
jgi:lipopolysaccharide transport system ATP-binding protein